MKKIHFLITDWIFFLDQDSLKSLRKIINEKEVIPELVTWKLIIIFLPLITFITVFLLNLLMNVNNVENYYNYFNNGSLPIISFGIITSGMPYLIEKLEDFPDYHLIRRRVMAVSMFFLFLTVSLYIFQTIKFPQLNLNTVSKIFITISSIYVFVFSFSIGVKMFLLQTKFIKSFDDEVKNGLDDHMAAIDNLD